MRPIQFDSLIEKLQTTIYMKRHKTTENSHILSAGEKYGCKYLKKINC